jgi:hypothetical protein
MKRVYAGMWIFVCLFAVSARAQDANSAPPLKNIIFDVKIIDMDGQTPETMETIARDQDRLNQMLAEGKVKLIAGTKAYCLVNELTNVRTGQRVPVQTATFPVFQSPGNNKANSPAPQQGTDVPHLAAGIPQIQYENTGFNLNLEPRLKRDGTIDLSMRIELTMISTDTGRLTPTFLTKNFMGTIKLKQNQAPIILEMFQNEFPAQSSTRASSANALRSNFFILLSTKTVD